MNSTMCGKKIVHFEFKTIIIADQFDGETKLSLNKSKERLNKRTCLGFMFH
jgi:hypothetical protein